jgi:hypothetical protein
VEAHVRGFVALVKGNGFRAVPIVADNFAEAERSAQDIGDVIAAIERNHVTALGMALAMARAIADGTDVLQA